MFTLLCKKVNNVITERYQTIIRRYTLYQIDPVGGFDIVT